jgi:small subunit ribosomal protein S27Ae
MQLFVQSHSGRTIALSALPSDSVACFKARVAEAVELGDASFHLVADKLLAEGATLGDYALAPEATVHVVLAVDGGKKKKKKKKIFKGPKKPTHRHKNVPMRVLKFYKVEGDGEDAEYKVTHDRIECPHPDCGAGVFMAVHKDRQTCGKCSLTYVFQKK